MSKRIVEYGNDSLITCNECGCKFVFEKEDIKDNKVTCPFCKSESTTFDPDNSIPMGGR